MKEYLTDKMDAVLAHQLQHLQRELQSMRITPKPFITISREFGCEGYPLAKRLSELLTTEMNPWNVFGHDAPPKFIPAFSWGKAERFKWDKAQVLVENLHQLNGISLPKKELGILKTAFEFTED